MKVNLEAWVAASGKERERILRALIEELGMVDGGDDGMMLPRVCDARGLVWRVVLPFVGRCGLSAEEWCAACAIEQPPPLTREELLPATLVSIGGLLVLEKPLQQFEAEALGWSPSIERRMAAPDVTSAFVTLEEANALVHQLESRLLNEREWEVCARGTSQKLFIFGNTLPPTDVLAGYVDPYSKQHTPNAFGFHSVFTGEWTASPFGAPFTGRTIKGGGASLFWPWQGAEWAYCMSAFRMPSDHTMNGTAAVRPAIDVTIFS